ncbi:unnamed protein product [Cladocopium goreaui]|uniref:Uncharacterized protein n=1 Tax=Cladocopium goreaui TaxID=2562237 RepID=A0A9P1GBG0_9DINO|nr:unnamed protein product [Cladocopium goreaui]
MVCEPVSSSVARQTCQSEHCGHSCCWNPPGCCYHLAHLGRDSLGLPQLDQEQLAAREDPHWELLQLALTQSLDLDQKNVFLLRCLGLQCSELLPEPCPGTPQILEAN